jgi:hypothetical protein
MAGHAMLTNTCCPIAEDILTVFMLCTLGAALLAGRYGNSLVVVALVLFLGIKGRKRLAAYCGAGMVPVGIVNLWNPCMM